MSSPAFGGLNILRFLLCHNSIVRKYKKRARPPRDARNGQNGGCGHTTLLLGLLPPPQAQKLPDTRLADVILLRSGLLVGRSKKNTPERDQLILAKITHGTNSH